MLSATDEMNNPIGRLTNRQIAAGFGSVEAHDKRSSIHGFDLAPGAIVTNQAKARPRLAFIERQRARHTPIQPLLADGRC